MKKVVKFALAVNGIALGINGVIVWLVVVKTFPVLLGVLLVLGFIAGAIWLSCYVNGALPYQRRNAFYTGETEKVEVP